WELWRFGPSAAHKRTEPRCQVRSCTVRGVGGRLFGEFAQDAPGDLGELGQIVAEIFRLVLGMLQELFEELEEHGRSNDDLRLLLDTIGIEIVLRAGYAPAAPIVIRGDHQRMGAGEGMMAALLGALPAILSAHDAPLAGEGFLDAAI